MAVDKLKCILIFRFGTELTEITELSKNILKFIHYVDYHEIILLYDEFLFV